METKLEDYLDRVDEILLLLDASTLSLSSPSPKEDEEKDTVKDLENGEVCLYELSMKGVEELEMILNESLVSLLSQRAACMAWSKSISLDRNLDPAIIKASTHLLNHYESKIGKTWQESLLKHLHSLVEVSVKIEAAEYNSSGKKELSWSLIRRIPEKEKLFTILNERLVADEDGDVSAEDIQALFMCLVDLKTEEVGLDHPEILLFQDMNNIERVDYLMLRVSKVDVDQDYSHIIEGGAIAQEHVSLPGECHEETVTKKKKKKRLSRRTEKILVSLGLDLPESSSTLAAMSCSPKELVSRLLGGKGALGREEECLLEEMEGVDVMASMEMILSMVPPEAIDAYYRVTFLGGDLAMLAIRAMSCKFRKIPCHLKDIKGLVSKFVEEPIENIADDHPAVVEWAGMTVDEMLIQLGPGTTDRNRHWEITKYWTRVKQLLSAEENKDFTKISTSETQLAVSELLGWPTDLVPNCVSEMLALIGLNAESLMNRVYPQLEMKPLPPLRGEESMPMSSKLDSNQWISGNESLKVSGAQSGEDRVMSLIVPSSSPLLATTDPKQTPTFPRSPDTKWTQEDARLRQAAADLADVPVESLPNPNDLRQVIKWLHELLVETVGGSVNTLKLVVVVKIFDERIPAAVVKDTVAAIGSDGKQITESDLMNWVVMMFADYSQEEFMASVLEFGEAAKASRRLAFQ